MDSSSAAAIARPSCSRASRASTRRNSRSGLPVRRPASTVTPRWSSSAFALAPSSDRALHQPGAERPPGHHAEYARAMGFCLLNNVAVGVYAAREKGVRRIAILDFDVHHGNGTQHSFADDAEVFYASTHQYPFYPGTGAANERGTHGNVLNVPLASGSGDRAFLGAWDGKIGPAGPGL